MINHKKYKLLTNLISLKFNGISQSPCEDSVHIGQKNRRTEEGVQNYDERCFLGD